MGTRSAEAQERRARTVQVRERAVLCVEAERRVRWDTVDVCGTAACRPCPAKLCVGGHPLCAALHHERQGGGQGGACINLHQINLHHKTFTHMAHADD